MSQEIEQALSKIEAHLARIAEALDVDRPAPNYRHTLADYPEYAWRQIGASVIERDDNGATRVSWQRQLYTRRSNPKFGHGVWFSRGAGRDTNGDTTYERLVTFADLPPVDKLPAEISQELPRPVAPPLGARIAHDVPEALENSLPGNEELDELDRFFPLTPAAPAITEPTLSPEGSRRCFYRLLPLAIAAGLAPEAANALSALAKTTNYEEPLATLEAHVTRLAAETV